jgi:hypothetical protein
MLKLEGWMDIQALRREGHSIRADVALTGHSRNTIRRALRQRVQEAFKAPKRADGFKHYVEHRYNVDPDRFTRPSLLICTPFFEFPILKQKKEISSPEPLRRA